MVEGHQLSVDLTVQLQLQVFIERNFNGALGLGRGSAVIITIGDFLIVIFGPCAVIAH